MSPRSGPLALVLLLVSVAPARAQSDPPATNRFAIGGDFKIKTSDRASDEDYARGQLGPGLLWRFGTPKPGFGFHWGVNWYAEANATNTLVLKPEIGVWYDITRKVFLNVNAGYMLARPDVEIVTAVSTERRKARADQFVLKVGVVYSIF